MTAAEADREQRAARQAAEDAAFVDAHYQGVFRFLLWVSRDPDLAADLTQETFAAYWASRGGGAGARPPEAELRAWLYGIARNRWRKGARARAREAERCAGSLDDPAGLDPAERGPGPESRVLAALDGERVARAVAELPAELREALVLRVWSEMEYSQVAAVLGISEGLARWRVHRGRLLLRRALEPAGEGEAGA